MEAIETTAEYVDDHDPEYVCLDMEGKRVRLIVWALELLVCQTVPDNFDPAGLRIMEGVEGSELLLVECFGSTSLRMLRGAGSALPAKWDQLGDLPDIPALTESRISVKDFHETWMKARLGKRY
ncbi:MULTISPECIES: hypothetical protein [unclassified Solwaraspora]|uniref:hypothetical protein n=1 Tax=unclassified Solwaraspora TaxID=2627926 RepID=UPI00259B65D0|nr:hypothetical protein [Solwaraspora sp. WMMA2056]WJK42777.1 hypothetical protein O7608_10550 [Solwaraspora sp. WMMA2056]